MGWPLVALLLDELVCARCFHRLLLFQLFDFLQTHPDAPRGRLTSGRSGAGRGELQRPISSRAACEAKSVRMCQAGMTNKSLRFAPLPLVRRVVASSRRASPGGSVTATVLLAVAGRADGAASQGRSSPQHLRPRFRISLDARSHQKPNFNMPRQPWGRQKKPMAWKPAARLMLDVGACV